MENNSFEKEVRRTLGNFRLEPEGKTWQTVEAQIRRKRRVLPLIWLMLAAAPLLLTGGYLLWNHGFSADPESILIPSKNQSLPEANALPQEKDSSFRTTSDRSDSEEVPSEKFLTKIYAPRKAQTSSVSEENIDDVDIRPQDPARQKATEDKNNLPEPGSITPLSLLKPENNLSIPDRIRNIETNLISPVIKIIPQKPQKKWDFSVMATGGSAMLFDSFLDLGSPEDPPAQNSPDPNPDPGNPSGPGTGGPPHAPTPVFAFSAHLRIEKPLSSRSRISLAPGYRQIGISQGTGEKVMTSGGEYFLNHPDAPHRRRGSFHFLELPVSIETRLNENGSLPLFWHGGIHISRLLGSDVLQFSEENSYYIRDDALFTPWQTGLSTGVDLMIFSRQKHPFKIGPYFYYNFSKIAREGLYDGKHLSSAGLKIECLLN